MMKFMWISCWEWLPERQNQIPVLTVCGTSVRATQLLLWMSREFAVRLIMMLSAVFALQSPAFAQPAEIQPTPPAISRDRLTLGLAVAVSPSYDGSDDYRVSPGGLVQGQVSGFSFAARGTNIYIDLLREAPRSKIDFVAGPVVQLRLERNANIRDPQVAALGKIKPALELGGYVGIGTSGVINSFDKLSFDVSYRADVSGIHNSAMISPTINYVTPLSRRTLALLAVSADHVGRKYGQTYFDVPTTANSSGLAPYGITRAGWKSASGNLLIVQSLGADLRKGWSIFAFGGYARVLGQYARSPIVRDAGSADQLVGFAGLAYSF
jgi:MipA family protein